MLVRAKQTRHADHLQRYKLFGSTLKNQKMFRTPPKKRQTGGLRTDGRGNADARKEAGRKRRGNEIRN